MLTPRRTAKPKLDLTTAGTRAQKAFHKKQRPR